MPERIVYIKQWITGSVSGIVSVSFLTLEADSRVPVV